MIQKIQTNILSSDRRNNKSQPQFTGMENFLIQAIQACEKQPMVNVAVLDLSTAIVPRTVVEGQTNTYAGLEAFRRESSGLIINCMIPGVIVMGIAKAVEPIIGGSSKMSNCWANEDTIDLITKEWQQAEEIAKDSKGNILYEGEPQKATKSKVYNTIKNILEKTRGIDGDKTRQISELGNFEESIKELTEKSMLTKYSGKDKTAISKAYEKIIAKTHISENIKIAGYDTKTINIKGEEKIVEKYFSQSFESVIKSTPRILRELVNGRDASDFANSARKLVNIKSIGGMAVILPLAIAAQPINRWITAKTSGKKGAPIYKDFKDTETKELTSKEKAALFKQKLISVGTMVGFAFLSMGGKLPTKKVLQYKGIFPSMDQARIIATATFASRMMASQDKNDLREATVRDIATFSSFYFLGDYVAKGIATLIQNNSKKGVKLINELAPSLEKNASIWKKIKHWTKNTALKSSDEVIGKAAKRARSFCQLGNIAFSLLSLGLLIPIYNRHTTNKKREAELKNRGVDQTTIDKYYKDRILFASKTNAYNAFFASK